MNTPSGTAHDRRTGWTRALSFMLLLALAACLATWLEPWFQSWAGSRTASANLISVALGDSRRLFAKHFYVKADAYFHSGYYPSIFDERPDEEKLHMAANAGAGHDGHADLPESGKPRDWIERFSRHFYPSVHTHLGDAKCNDPHHDHGHVHGPDCKHEDHGHVHGPDCKHDHHEEADDGGVRDQRELLPWLKLAATLDPERPETYVTAAFWLRSQLGKVAEAEAFLREGLRHVPGDPDLLFELGRIYRENHKNNERATAIWEAALARWHKERSFDEASDRLLFAQLHTNLAKIAEEEKNFPRTIEHLQELLRVTPHKDAVEQWIAELSAKVRSASAK